MATVNAKYAMRMIEESNRNKLMKSPIGKNSKGGLKERDKLNELLEKKKKDSSKRKKKSLKKKIDLKATLLSECIYMLLNESCTSKLNITETENIKRNLVDNFIEEHGPTKLLGEYRTKSYVLSEFVRNINETYEYLVEKAKDDGEEFDSVGIYLDKDMRANFYGSLKTDDVEEVIDVIRHRVVDAIGDFSTVNASDKHAIKQIVKTAEEKVNSDMDSSLEEAVTIGKKRMISTIRNRGVRGVYESMVYNSATNILKNNDTREQFVTESGLDMDSIIETSEIMYTFLEVINTAKLDKVDASYIDKIINTK